MIVTQGRPAVSPMILALSFPRFISVIRALQRFLIRQRYVALLNYFLDAQKDAALYDWGNAAIAPDPESWRVSSVFAPELVRDAVVDEISDVAFILEYSADNIPVPGTLPIGCYSGAIELAGYSFLAFSFKKSLKNPTHDCLLV